MASRFGTLDLTGHVCQHLDTQTHVLPGNSLLPAHHRISITRGLQECACLLPEELPFAAVAGLLGWQTHERQVLSDTTVGSIVRSHGQISRQVEQNEVAAVLQRSDLARLDLLLVPHDQPRRRAGWPAELNATVDAGLAAEQAYPGAGVSWAEWERVLAARRAEARREVEALRHLGAKLEPDQVLVTVDEVLRRKPEPQRFWELRTAQVVRPDGYR